jgi:hypothetical protein
VAVAEPLAVLLLPSQLEAFELEEHALELLSIPRVLALEPGRWRTPAVLRDALAIRQARKLRFPGTPRLLAIYDPLQYPLARALCGRYEGSELWYIRRDPAGLVAAHDDELGELDQLARERATAFLVPDDQSDGWAMPLRLRLRELEIISPRAFVPGARIERR